MACHGSQNGLLISLAIDDQHVPMSCSSRSLRAASSRRKRARVRQSWTIARMRRAKAPDELIEIPGR